jgi:putative transposase
MRRCHAWVLGCLMSTGLKRYYGQGDLHFITFSCYGRLPLLGTVHARNIFVDALSKIQERYKFLLAGYVVMPDHVHLLISETPQVTSSLILEVLKQRVSRDLRKIDRGGEIGASSIDDDPMGGCPMRRCHTWVLGSPFPVRLPRFWQARFYDFNVYSPGKKREKLHYMHANPVERGLVKHPNDWQWSSFSYYAKGQAGFVPIDPVD